MADPARVLRASSSHLADHTTPFVRDEWYVAAFADELDRSLRSRTLLGVDVLLYRRQDGVPIALRNRCPHRSFPLSRGRLDGDRVICGYHGLAFGPDGRCAHIPSQALVPSGVAAQAFPVVERGPLVWIWMGEPQAADPGAIPEHPWLASPDYTHIAGYIHVACNYVRLHENVLDLTHFPFLHGEAVGDIAFAQSPFDVEEAQDQVRIIRRLTDHPVNLGYGSMIGNLGHRVNRTSDARFVSPALHVAHATVEDLEGGVGGRTAFHFKIQHMFTPETATSTHYFWASARDVAIDDQTLSDGARERVRATFMEDVEALEAIERIWADEPPEFREISVTGDRAGLLMRRIIARRAQARPI